MAQLESSKEKRKPEIDIIQATIGNFGSWQLKLSVLMALLKVPIAWFQLSIVFLAPPTEFWCKVSEPLNFTNNWWKDIQLQREGLNTGLCHMIDFENHTTQSIPCINGYDYNKTIFHSSIITEWDLVCENKRLVDLTQITLMLGVLIGNIFFGILADRKGRKHSLIICIFLQALLGIIAAWIPWFWGFVLARFLMAIANGGTIVVSFVMCMEVVGGVWRIIVPILYQIPFGFGNSIMSGLAYYYRDWREIQLAISMLSSLFICYIWFIPESPRWLLVVGKKEKAIKILREAAKCNKLDPGKVEEAVTYFSSQTNPKGMKNRPSISTLFSTRELRKRTILLCMNWLIGGITFYAFSQYVGKVGRNIFLTTALSGFIALPGTILCVYIVKQYGRRWTIASAHLVTALCFFGILMFPTGVYIEDWPRIAFAGAGIIGLSISMPALYLFTGELFPTSIRNVGVGNSLMFSRLGSMVAPLVIAMQDISSSLPLLVLGISTLLETVLILPLAETKGKPLPETVHDLQEQKNQHRAEIETLKPTADEIFEEKL